MRHAILLFALFLSSFAVACNMQYTPNKRISKITLEQLRGKHFSLYAIDNRILQKDDPAQKTHISFDKNGYATGVICNRFMGQAKIIDEKLVIHHMASTKMFCANATLNELEATFGAMMEKGALLFYNDNTLRLENESTRLIFSLMDS